MKVVLLTADQPNQWALAHKLAKVVDVTAVVFSRNIPRKPPRRRTRILVNRIEGRLVGRPFVRAWVEMLARYRQTYPLSLQAETTRVDNVNDSAALSTLQRHAPDLVIVSGTNLVGKEIIAEAQLRQGIVNLHTGISPYIKGGPNCTNWCLAIKRFDLIGNTVMLLDPSIDTGPIIATERTPLTRHEGLTELHFKVMEHAHDLYRRSVVAIRDGLPVARIHQREIAEGTTFYTADWTTRPMARAYYNFRFHYPRQAGNGGTGDGSLRLVSLPTRPATVVSAL